MNFQLKLDTEAVGQAPLQPPLCIAPGVSVREAMKLLQEQRNGYLLICDQEALVGIFTERDALRMMATGADWDQPIDAVMVRSPVTAPAATTMGDAISLMSTGGYRRLPVVDGDQKPVGVLTVATILSYLVDHFPQIIYTLPPEPNPAPVTPEGA